MRRKRKIPIKVALILILLGTVSSWAEVKLRIYLQDGTLQAGNLVVENPDSFVILGKDGRVEVKKDKIMFINGKTLKQWQERPDKLFQTEIIPAEIPNPAYVNDKAPIPSLPPPVSAAKASDTKPVSPAKPPVAASASPAIQPVKPLPAVMPKAAESKPAENKTAEKPGAAPAKPAASAASAQNATTPAPAKEIPVAAKTTPAPVAAVAPIPLKPRHAKRLKHKAPVETVAVNKTVPPTIPAAKPPAVTSQAVVADIVPPTQFVRKDFGDYHYQRAVRFLNAGETGRAVQELHLATILDRQNGESVLLLGKLYMQSGQFERARKYFAHPLVRKREEVKTWNDEMANVEKQKERGRSILISASVAGALLWIPIMWGLRRLTKPTKRVFTAETVEELQSREETPSPEPSTPEPAFMAFKPASSTPQAAPPPVVPPPMSPVVPPPIAPLPVVTPVAPPIFAKSLEPPVPPPMPPPIVPPPTPAPLPVAESPVTPPPHTEGLDAPAVLRLASMVDRAIKKGNDLAVEEKFDLARREYRTAMALNPGCVEAYLGLGYLCFAQGQWDMSLEHYVKALGIDAASADAHYGIGRVFLEIERVDEAIFEFQKTLSLDPGFDDARETLTALGAAV